MGRKFDFEFGIFSREVISEMSNDDLKDHIVRFRRMIKEAQSLGQDTLAFETEFCYLDQERQYRLNADRVTKKYNRVNRGNKQYGE